MSRSNPEGEAEGAAPSGQLGKKDFIHPLEHIAWKLIDEKYQAIDVWDLAAALRGPCFKPENKAYDLAAADILETMFHSGRAMRTGNGNPKKPELANFFYSRANAQAQAAQAAQAAHEHKEETKL